MEKEALGRAGDWQVPRMEREGQECEQRTVSEGKVDG